MFTSLLTTLSVTKSIFLDLSYLVNKHCKYFFVKLLKNALKKMLHWFCKCKIRLKILCYAFKFGFPNKTGLEKLTLHSLARLFEGLSSTGLSLYCANSSLARLSMWNSGRQECGWGNPIWLHMRFACCDFCYYNPTDLCCFASRLIGLTHVTNCLYMALV